MERKAVYDCDQKATEMRMQILPENVDMATDFCLSVIFFDDKKFNKNG